MSGVKGRSGRRRIPGMTRDSSGHIRYGSPSDTCSCGRQKTLMAKKCERCSGRNCWRIEHANCLVCGRLYIRSNRNRSVETCSYECGQTLGRARQDKRLVTEGRSRKRTFTCAGCGKLVTRYLNSGNDIGKYCSRECAFNDPVWRSSVPKRLSAWRATRTKKKPLERLPYKECICGLRIKSNRKWCDNCSKHVYAIRSRNRTSHLRREPSTVPCPMCGATFTPTRIGTIYCSKRCSKRAKNWRCLIPYGVFGDQGLAWRTSVFEARSLAKTLDEWRKYVADQRKA